MRKFNSLFMGLPLILAACGQPAGDNPGPAGGRTAERPAQAGDSVTPPPEDSGRESAALAAVQTQISADFSDVWYDPEGYAEFAFSEAYADAKASALFYQDGFRVMMHVRGANMPPGRMGIHLHEFGDCSAPDFTSAGGHIGKDDAQHGLQNPDGPESGDLRNLLVDVAGEADMAIVTRVLFEQRGGARPKLIDSDGSAVVIHVQPDDQMTQPIGGAGARIACAVIRNLEGSSTNAQAAEQE